MKTSRFTDSQIIEAIKCGKALDQVQKKLVPPSPDGNHADALASCRRQNAQRQDSAAPWSRLPPPN
ncbi:hypothetical protein ACMZ4X_01685 [Achromobacter marplatensis]